MGQLSRQRWADVGRGFAIFTIVFFHSALALQPHGEVDWKIWLCVAVFSPVPIALFFFISGLFTRRIVDGSWSPKLITRLAGLVYVFVIWSAIDMALASLLGQESEAAENLWTYILNPKSPLWFIWGLVIFTTLSNLIWSRWPKSTVCLAFAISLLSFTNIIPVSSFVYENLLRFFPFFLVGLSGTKMTERVLAHRFKILALGSFLYGGLIFVYLHLDRSSAGAGLIWVTTAWIALPLSIAASALIAGIPFVGSLAGRLGRASLPIYLAHQTIERLLVRAGLVMIGVIEEPQLISVFVLASAVILVTAVFAEVSIKLRLTALFAPPKINWRRANGATSAR